MPFNDPRFTEMGQYEDVGESGNKLSGAIAGADINLFEAWKVETGSPNVIVAVMDGGIQYNHPDLADNMWINEAEFYGIPGVDDDNNGYIDDIYGWNFVTNTGNVTQYEHGTHVAGTIGAVTNHGRGIKYGRASCAGR